MRVGEMISQRRQRLIEPAHAPTGPHRRRLARVRRIEVAGLDPRVEIDAKGSAIAASSRKTIGLKASSSAARRSAGSSVVSSRSAASTAATLGDTDTTSVSSASCVGKYDRPAGSSRDFAVRMSLCSSATTATISSSMKRCDMAMSTTARRSRATEARSGELPPPARIRGQGRQDHARAGLVRPGRVTETARLHGELMRCRLFGGPDVSPFGSFDIGSTGKPVTAQRRHAPRRHRRS